MIANYDHTYDNLLFDPADRLRLITEAFRADLQTYALIQAVADGIPQAIAYEILYRLNLPSVWHYEAIRSYMHEIVGLPSNAGVTP